MTMHNAGLCVEPRRPLVRYHGGKWKLAPWIIRHLPQHRVYVEPYGGAGTVLLAFGADCANALRKLGDRGVFIEVPNAELMDAPPALSAERPYSNDVL